MPKLAQIVEDINNAIKTNGLPDARFASASVNGIAILMPRALGGGKYEVIPAIPTLDGDGQYVGFDDTQVLTLYHRNIGVTYVPDKPQFGGNNNIVIQTTNMSIIVLGLRKNIQLTAEELEVLIVNAMPTVLPTATIQAYGLNSLVITNQGSDFDFMKIFQREFKTPQMKVFPLSMMLFEIKYKIECKYKKDCINTLCC